MDFETGVNIQTIVVATDLVADPDEVVRAAGALAELTSSDLHVIHVVEGEDGPSLAAREATLDDRVRRSLPPRFSTAAQVVLRGVSAAEAIRLYATDVSAGLIVVGPHREASDRVIGTTADRLARTAGIPCLILRGPLTVPLRSTAVLTDFSPAARAAVEVARKWVGAFAGGAGSGESPRITLGHLLRPATGSDEDASRMEKELRRSWDRMGSVEGTLEPTLDVEILRGDDPPALVQRWAREREFGLLVLGTHGATRLPYSYVGGFASAVTRAARCPVLLVPPRYEPRQTPAASGEPRLSRIIVAVDLEDSSWEAALWSMRYLAPQAEHELLHVIDTPSAPAPLRALTANRSEQRREARESAEQRLRELRDLTQATSVGIHIREGRPESEITRLTIDLGADLVVVGPHGPRRGLSALLGTTAERVLVDSPAPVLVAREPGDSAPHHIIAAVDSTPASDPVLAWAMELVERFDSRITVMNVVDRSLLLAGHRTLPEAAEFRRSVDESVKRMEKWLIDRIHDAHLPDAVLETKVVVGDPAYEIISEAAQKSADLIIVGGRPGGVAWTPLIGRVVNKIVRSAPCSVLVTRTGEGGDGAPD